MSALSSAQIETFLEKSRARLCPSSMGMLCGHLRSYLRFRATQGDTTQALALTLPSIANWPQSTLPKCLSETQLKCFLAAFDCSNPVQLRDYAIARCLLDLALRADEVTHLELDSIDWTRGIVSLASTKSRRVQQLPLLSSTGEVIARYLRQARPRTHDRRLFVRHRAPIGIPLGVPAIRNAMNRAFLRCGLRAQFCNTHVLRSTTATRLQQLGTSLKEIADVLRHRSLDTARHYVRVDLEVLRAVALPWPGAQP